MNKSIAGSLIILLCGNVLTWAQPENVSLAVLNLERNPISKVVVGEPFLVAIEYIITGSTISSPDIDGMDNLHIISSRVSHSPIGSRVLVRSEYTVRIDTMQDSCLGPIRIGTYEYAITQSIKTIEPKSSTVRGTQTEPFALLTVSDSEPVIGQPVECTTTLFVPKQLSIEVLGSQVDTSDHMGMLSTDNNIEEYRGLRLFEGKEHQHISWQWTIIPRKSGKITIPASSVDYSPLDQTPTSFFASFWGHRTVKRVFSNSVSITIGDLPEHKGPIHAIASRPHVDVHVDTTQISVGDALEYAINIQSEQPIALHDPHILSALPSTVKHYASTPTITQRDTTYQLRIASVLQCLEENNITIPEQLLRIYDSDQKKIIEWTLPAHTIIVTPGQTPVPTHNNTHEITSHDDHAEQLKQRQEQQHREHIAAIIQQLVPLSAPPQSSYTFFETLAWFMIICLLLYSMTPAGLLQQLKQSIRPSYAYYHARALICIARLTNKPHMLWGIMQQFFFMRGIICTNNGTQLTYELPHKLQLIQSERERFIALWTTIAQARMNKCVANSSQLFKELSTWLRDYHRGNR